MPIPQKTPWKDTVVPHSPALSGDIETDVVIVGGGITGIVTAYLLAVSKKKKIVILEKDRIGSGATEYTTAFLTQVIDTDISDLKQMFGMAKTKKIIKSHGDAINLIEKIVNKHSIDCEFKRCSNYSYANDEKERDSLVKEAESAKGLPIDLKFKNDSALGFDNYGYLEIKNQGKFHPIKYISSLVSVLQELEVDIYEQSEVKEIAGKGPYTLTTDNGSVKAKQVVSATYGPLKKELFFKKAFYDTYVIEIESETGVIPEGIFEDNMNPYHYFRVDRLSNKDRIIIGGEDHRSDIKVDNSKNFQALLDYMDTIFRGFPYKVLRKWEGPIIEPVDGLAYIGAHKVKNMYYATGFSGNGMTYSHIAAQIIADQILGKKNIYSSIYDANRKPNLKSLIKKGRDYGSELAYGAVKNTFKYRKKKI